MFYVGAALTQLSAAACLAWTFSLHEYVVLADCRRSAPLLLPQPKLHHAGTCYPFAALTAAAAFTTPAPKKLVRLPADLVQLAPNCCSAALGYQGLPAEEEQGRQHGATA